MLDNTTTADNGVTIESTESWNNKSEKNKENQDIVDTQELGKNLVKKVITGSLGENIVGNVCPNCQDDGYSILGCTSCDFGIEVKNANETTELNEEDVYKRLFIETINNTDGLFTDIKYQDVQIESTNDSMISIEFHTKGYDFKVEKQGKETIFMVNGFNFNIKELDKQEKRWDLFSKIFLNYLKAKEKTIYNGKIDKLGKIQLSSTSFPQLELLCDNGFCKIDINKNFHIKYQLRIGRDIINIEGEGKIIINDGGNHNNFTNIVELDKFNIKSDSNIKVNDDNIERQLKYHIQYYIANNECSKI